MKRITALVLSLVLILTLLPASVSASGSAPNATFSTVNGGTASVYSTNAELSIAVFGRDTCYNTKSTINNIITNGYDKKNGVYVSFIDFERNPKSDVSEYAASFPDSKINFCYDTSTTAENVLSQYMSLGGLGNSVTLPVVAFIDGNGEIVNVTSGVVSAAYLENVTVNSKIFNEKLSFAVSGTENYTYANEVLTRLNSLRASLGLAQLQMDSQLLETAMQRAAEIAIYYSHDRPDNTSCFDLITNASYWGENIAIGQTSPEDVMNSWTNSPGHYANMTSGSFNSVGIGAFKTSNGTWCWVQYFARKAVTSVSKSGSETSTRNVKAIYKNLQLEIQEDVYNLKVLDAGESFNVKIINYNLPFPYATQELGIGGFTFSSSNTKVLTVDSNGKCTVKGVGKATITATSTSNPLVSFGNEFDVGHVHSQGDYPKRDSTHHWYLCSVCGDKMSKTAHVYSNSCDTDCNKCGWTRIISHSYAPATCTKAKTCTVCKATSGETLGHSYKTKTVTKATLSKNGKKVKVCTVCGKKGSTSKIYSVKTVKLKTTSFTYNGENRKPTVTVKDSKGKKVSSKYYTVEYPKAKSVGTYKVKIKFKGNYQGAKTLTFKINPKKPTSLKLTAGKKSINVKWSKVSSQATGYELECATNKKFTENKKTAKISKAKTEKKTIKKLSRKKTYYVRIRTYETVKGKKYYSGWVVKRIKTK